MLYYDTETCGFHGPIILIQYAEDRGDIVLYNVWKHSISETLELIEWMMSKTVIGFNLTFDHFHLSQMYNSLSLMSDPMDILEDRIADYLQLKIYQLKYLQLK